MRQLINVMWIENRCQYTCTVELDNMVELYTMHRPQRNGYAHKTDFKMYIMCMHYIVLNKKNNVRCLQFECTLSSVALHLFFSWNRYSAAID